MTALNDFERLECTGIWLPSPDSQRRDVIVSVGEATLTLADQQNSALAHWSLPAIRRVNPGERPALFRPGAESLETLEISDETMVSAISRVRTAIQKRVPRPGRLRFVLTGGSIIAVLLLVLFWLPGAMLKYTASVVPDPKRQSIGEALLSNIQRVSGRPCDNLLGTSSLGQLYRRVLPNQTGKIVIVSSGVQETVLLPGQIIVANRALVEDFEEPDVMAGHMLAAKLRGQQIDPLDQLLRETGLLASFRLLTTGDLPDSTLAKYAESLLTKQSDTVPEQALLAEFESAEVRSSPYAYALDISGETTINLIEADPIKPGEALEILSDGEWVALQGICTE